MTRLTIYGDFNCPFSALASVRADVLLAAGGTRSTGGRCSTTRRSPPPANPSRATLLAELAAEVATIRELSADDVHLALRCRRAFEHRRRVRRLRRRR